MDRPIFLATLILSACIGGNGRAERRAVCRVANATSRAWSIEVEGHAARTVGPYHGGSIAAGRYVAVEAKTNARLDGECAAGGVVELIDEGAPRVERYAPAHAGAAPTESEAAAYLRRSLNIVFDPRSLCVARLPSFPGVFLLGVRQSDSFGGPCDGEVGVVERDASGRLVPVHGRTDEWPPPYIAASWWSGDARRRADATLQWTTEVTWGFDPLLHARPSDFAWVGAPVFTPPRAYEKAGTVTVEAWRMADEEDRVYFHARTRCSEHGCTINRRTESLCASATGFLWERKDGSTVEPKHARRAR